MSAPSSASTTVGALLFSDVENSTALTTRLGAAGAAALWAAHDRRARDLLVAHDGREIGRADGLFLLFDSVVQAARYALDYHAALAPLGVSARIGLHAGTVTLRANAPGDVARGAAPLEVDSLATPVTARLMALARGGQTLVSAEACAALAADLPNHAQVERHGHYRLKGIEEPLEVYELGVRGTASFQPPPDAAKAYRVVRNGDLWLPLRQIRHNLPAERDAFVGRKAELRALATRLADGTRLLTVQGPGGTGKTRTVRRYAWTWLGDWPGGVSFCDLSEARSLEGILFAVAAALPVPLGRSDPVAQLGQALAGRGRCLVILDNFEQVTGHAAATVGRWLDGAPEATFVVTSRERLQVPGEEIFPLEPLPIEGDAIELFTRRALAQDPRFTLNDANQAAVAEAVRLLDGLPLAIELAAARIRLLPPAQLVARLRERFSVLSGMHGAKARQATLQAAIDWSWELLSPWEKTAFAQCSTFDGGFTLVAAEAVLDLAAWPDAPAAMDVIQALCDKSLLRTWLPGDAHGEIGAPLIGMYISIHEYAAQKLAAGGKDAQRRVEQRHGAFYARMGTADAIESLSRNGGVERRRDLARMLDNLVTACRRAVARGDAGVAVESCMAAASVLELQGPGGLNLALGAEVLGLTNLRARDRMRVLNVHGTALRRGGRAAEAEEALQAALALARATGDERQEARVLADLGTLRQGQGRFAESRDFSEAGLRLAHRIGNRRLEGGILNNLGVVDALQGRLDEARSRLSTALRLHREVGDRQSEGVDTLNLANLLRIQGEMAAATDHFERALSIHREVGDLRNEGLAIGNLGALYGNLCRVDEGVTCCVRALTIHREVGNRHAEGSVLATLGELQGRQGRFDAARSSLDLGERLLREVADDEERALLLCARASVEIDAGDRVAAHAALDEAEAILVALEIGVDSQPGRRVLELRAALDRRAP